MWWDAVQTVPPHDTDMRDVYLEIQVYVPRQRGLRMRNPIEYFIEDVQPEKRAVDENIRELQEIAPHDEESFATLLPIAEESDDRAEKRRNEHIAEHRR
jgi:hypothetical protein